MGSGRLPVELCSKNAGRDRPIATMCFKIAAFACVVLMSSIARAAEDKIDGHAIGLLVAVRGDAEAIDAEGVSRELRIKDPVYRGDNLRTGKRGRLQVMFMDRTILGFGPETEIQIVEYGYNANARSGNMTISVGKGVFRVLGGAITQVAPVEFKTEKSQQPISILGSFYAGGFLDQAFRVVSLGGERIIVSSDTGRVAITRPLYGTTVVGADMTPGTPARLLPEDIAYFSLDVSGDAEYEPTINAESVAVSEFARWGHWSLDGNSLEDSYSWANDRWGLAAEVRDLLDMSRTGGGGCPT